MIVDAIIGANYGDEGKGTITARLTSKSTKVLNVLTNGGAQRGHSVTLPNGTQTIFKHFGSGTLFGSTTFCDKDFIINPMQFVKECEELGYSSIVYFHPDCKFTTPFDMIVNQILEDKAGFGSCGMGIWETVLRYHTDPTFTTFSTFCRLSHIEKIDELKKVKKYFEIRLNNLGLELKGEWKDIWNREGLITHFVQDVNGLSQMKCTTNPLKQEQFDRVILENGQGLLLNDTGKDDKDTTPSQTGSNAILQSIVRLGLKDNVTLHYITRPYITRHGAKGRDFLGKTKLESIGIDFTHNWEINKEGSLQGALEYGLLDIEALKKRIDTDSHNPKTFYNAKVVLEVTHNDQMQREKEFKKYFDNINFYDNPFVR